MVRREPTADASFAAILDLIKFVMAIAAMINMIATAMRSSISENHFCVCIRLLPELLLSAHRQVHCALLLLDRCASEVTEVILILIRRYSRSTCSVPTRSSLSFLWLHLASQNITKRNILVLRGRTTSCKLLIRKLVAFGPRAACLLRADIAITVT